MPAYSQGPPLLFPGEHVSVVWAPPSLATPSCQSLHITRATGRGRGHLEQALGREVAVVGSPRVASRSVASRLVLSLGPSIT